MPERHGRDGKACTDPPPPSEAAASALAAQDDHPAVYADDCWSLRPFTERRVCHYGARDGDERIAILGNSHAGQWQPPIAEAASANGWSLDTFLISECYPVDVPLDLGNRGLSSNCSTYTDWALRRIERGDYDAVVISNRSSLLPLRGVASDDQLAEKQAAFGRVIDRLTGAGVRVLVIRDTPTQSELIPDCVASHLDAPARCSTSRTAALPADPLAAAASARPGPDVRVLDLSDRLCDATRCYGVVDGEIAYTDSEHLTRTFSRSLRPTVEHELRAIIDPTG